MDLLKVNTLEEIRSKEDMQEIHDELQKEKRE